MVNQEHIDLLMQEVDTWNAWWWGHQGMQAHLRETALGKMMLREVDLRYGK